MMEHLTSKGWKNRRRAADARKAENADDERAEIRRIRAAMAQAEVDANEAAFDAQKAALEAERCACPACAGTGRVTVETAAGLLEAWFRYKEQGYRPSRATVAALANIANGRPPSPGAVMVTASYGMTVPGPGMVCPEPVAATVETVKPAKASKGKPTEDLSFTNDGFLIEP